VLLQALPEEISLNPVLEHSLSSNCSELTVQTERDAEG